MTTADSRRAMIARTMEVVTRQDVRVSQKYGWVVVKASDTIAGSVWLDSRATGQQPRWMAASGDVFGWAHTRADAIAKVIELHNMQEKARGYDLLSRVSS